MTNHWIDIRNSDVILIMGSNAAENHPISFKWVTEAKEKGATLISVDPRFTRTSAKADIYAPMRSGSDIPFIGGLVNYILQNDLYHILHKILSIYVYYHLTDKLLYHFDSAQQKLYVSVFASNLLI